MLRVILLDFLVHTVLLTLYLFLVAVPPDFDFAALQGLFQQFMAMQGQAGAGGNDPVAMIMQQCCNIL